MISNRGDGSSSSLAKALCNANPTEEETFILGRAIEEDEKNVANITADIEQLEKSREFDDALEGFGLLLRRAELLARISAYKEVLSAIRRIPPEIIIEIFLHCRLSTGVETCIRPLSLIDSPVFLTHICSRWRYAALGIPRLWTDVFVNFYLAYDRHQSEELVDLMCTWFSRAASALSLSVFEVEKILIKKTLSMPLSRDTRVGSGK